MDSNVAATSIEELSGDDVVGSNSEELGGVV